VIEVRSDMTLSSPSALEDALGHHFHRLELLEQALTHSSYARELESIPGAGPVGDNEQLEFLGDSVLGLVTSQELLTRFPHFREGQLSKLRAHLVSEKHLVRIARHLELGQYLRLGRGEEKSGGRHKAALLADCMEAVLGAMYLDSGLGEVQRVVLQFIIEPELKALAQTGKTLPQTDFKSALQEKLQAAGRPQPSYVLVEERGPDHRKTFTVEARLQPPGNDGDAAFVGRAEGSTKKNAEQEAARQLLEHLESPTAGSEGATAERRSS
jgi:ribonuclease III